MQADIFLLSHNEEQKHSHHPFYLFPWSHRSGSCSLMAALHVKGSKGRGPGCNGSSTMLMICRLRAIDSQAQFHIGPAANMETTRFTTATTCASIVCFPIDRVKFPT